ncbi:BrnA antitoxin family protein [Rhizobium sullae]|uniref:BrnA antitoxin family protein n=1 Tax=Rhizobium sullae TaxID=50338 RepID=UPI00288BD5FC|nr:BrnA antitoxin family protein [Rhizobium sullae]
MLSILPILMVGRGYSKQHRDEVSDNPNGLTRTSRRLARLPKSSLSLPRASAVRAGGRGSKKPKRQISLRLDPDMIDAFKTTGKGWQGRINEALRKAAKL